MQASNSRGFAWFGAFCLAAALSFGLQAAVDPSGYVYLNADDPGGTYSFAADNGRWYRNGEPIAGAVSETKPAVPDRMRLFPLSDVRVTGGRFLALQELDRDYLLSLEPDRLLSLFRKEAGLEPKAKPYPGWEGDDMWGWGPLAGHILGFYMSSMSMMYQSTGDGRILERLRYVMSELKACQDAFGDGYVLATPGGHALFEKVGTGDFAVTGGCVEGKFEPTYVLNKIMLGLLKVHTLCGIAEARTILVGLANWFGRSVLDRLDHDQVQRLLFCEHGSLSEGFAELYGLTGSPDFLRWALRLNDERVLQPLADGRDILPGLHANTAIAKFTGFNDIRRWAGDGRCGRAAENFWRLVTASHIWANGGNSVDERFLASEDREWKMLRPRGPESCNSVNMMRLTESLYRHDPRPEYVDFYERVLFSHILANYDPKEGMCCYYTPMRPGHYRVYGSPYASFWCCTGTGLEAPAKFARMTYAHDSEALYVNLFMPSSIEWREKGLRLVQETRFPDEDRMELAVDRADKPVEATVRIRNPRWVEPGGLQVAVNGEAVPVDPAARFVDLRRTWKAGDRVAVSFRPRLAVTALPGGDRYLSVSYGPVLLGTRIADVKLREKDFRYVRDPVAAVNAPVSIAPVLSGGVEEIRGRIRRRPGPALAFDYMPPDGAAAVALEPFYDIHFSRYAIYFVRGPAGEDDVGEPIRPGDPERGVPFWNDYATVFRYAPAFSFARIDGAAKYRFTVGNAAASRTFEADRPWAPLTPVWKDLPNGTGYSATCEGLDASGRVIGRSGVRRFTKTAAFADVKLPPAARPYREAARMIYGYMTSLPAMRTLLETGKPDQTYQHNANVSTTHAAHIEAMLGWARLDPSEAEKALAFAKASADYLLGELEPADAPLAWWPPTYGRRPLECDASKDGGARRESMVGNEPAAAVRYRKEVMLVYPAMVGTAFLHYRRAIGDGGQKYLEAACGIAETYLRIRRADGSWPLKAVLATGEPVGRSTLVPTAPMTLFGELADATGDAKWRQAADECLDWLEKGPVRTMNWDGQFEDIEPKRPYMGLTKHNALDTMLWILKRYPGDEGKLSVARDLIRFSEDQFVFWEPPSGRAEKIPAPGTGGRNEPPAMGEYGGWDYPSVFEQYSCYCAIDASAAKLIRAYVALWKATGNPTDLAKARALADAITRVQLPSGRVPTFWSHDWVATESYDWLNCMAASAAALVECAAASAEVRGQVSF